MGRVRTVAASVGLAALGVGLLGGPALAASPAGGGRGDGTCTGTGVPAGDGSGAQVRAGGRHAAGPGGAPTRARDGSCSACTAAPSGTLAAAPSGTLTSEQKAELAVWAEEEKVALDLYTAFGVTYDSGPFERIAASEARHLEAVRRLMDTYGVADPTDGAAPGAFTDAELRAMYTALLEQGSASVDAALAVGRAVETDDLALLADASDGVTAPDVLRVIAAQTAASERHLAAFGG